MTDALQRQKYFEIHRKKLKEAKPTNPAEQSMSEVDSLINGFLMKKQLR